MKRYKLYDLFESTHGRSFQPEKISAYNPKCGIENDERESFEDAWHRFAQAIGIIGYIQNKAKVPKSDVKAGKILFLIVFQPQK